MSEWGATRNAGPADIEGWTRGSGRGDTVLSGSRGHSRKQVHILAGERSDQYVELLKTLHHLFYHRQEWGLQKSQENNRRKMTHEKAFRLGADQHQKWKGDGICGGQNHGPQDGHILIPEPGNVASCMAKGILQMSLSEEPRDGEIIPEYPGGPNVTTRVLIRGR